MRLPPISRQRIYPDSPLDQPAVRDTRCAMCGLLLEPKWHAGGMVYHQHCYDQLAAILRPDEPWPTTPDELANRLKEHRTMGLHDHGNAGAAIGPGPNIGAGRYIGLGDPVDLTKVQADRIEALRYRGQQQAEQVVTNACAPAPALIGILDQTLELEKRFSDLLERLSALNTRLQLRSPLQDQKSGPVGPGLATTVHPDSLIGRIERQMHMLKLGTMLMSEEIAALDGIA